MVWKNESKKKEGLHREKGKKKLRERDSRKERVSEEE